MNFGRFSSRRQKAYTSHLHQRSGAIPRLIRQRGLIIDVLERGEVAQGRFGGLVREVLSLPACL